MHDPGAIIIGGGLTGVSAALHLRHPYLLLEREERLGGLARTEERDGFWFDQTGHWLHLRDPAMQELVARQAGEAMLAVARRAQIFAGGVFVPYPFQANVHALPREMAYDCLLGYVQGLLRRGGTPPRNFEQYILHHFGEGIARHFMIPYNAKLWGVHPREITSAWCSRFVPLPTLEEMVAGAVGSGRDELGYNVHFQYPRRGGIESFFRALANGVDPARVRLGAVVEAVDPRRRVIRAGGEELPYRALISTMPLPALVGVLVDPPEAVTRAAGRLRGTAVRYLNVATRGQPAEGYHWLYVPEERLPFYRLGVYSSAAPAMAPPGCSSFYVELASREPGADPRALVADAVRGMVAVGAVASAEEIVFADLRQIDPAYVIFDEAYEESRGTVLAYLENNDILSCGRYGSWTYNSMEDSLLEGRQAAARIDEKLAVKPSSPGA